MKEIVVALAAVALVGAGSAASGDSASGVQLVKPGGSIQAAADPASGGDTVVVFPAFTASRSCCGRAGSF